MKIQLPKRETFSDFVNVVSDQLTPLERNLLIPAPPSPPLAQAEALRRFYLIWTLKEAYTKALGLGLGFDFKRIEYDVVNDVVLIDGAMPRNWEFVRFEVANPLGNGRDEIYVGVTARFLGDGAPAGEACVVESKRAGTWLKVFDAVEFIERALRELR